MSRLAEAAEGLQTVLARLQRIDLWPPWDAAQTIADAVGAAYAIASESPAPTSADLEDAAAGWRRLAAGWTRASTDVSRTRAQVDAPDAWTGPAGDGFRSSLSALTSRMDTVPTAANSSARALDACADAMRAARSRHEGAYDHLGRHLTVAWSDLLPWQLVDHLRDIVEDVVVTMRELIGAYEDADSAVERCAARVTAAVDEIALPVELVDGASAVDQVNVMGGGAQDDQGPLRGSTAERAEGTLAAMTPADRTAALALLDHARDDRARGWILAAIASGLSGGVLADFAGHLGAMTPAQLAALDPGTTTGTFTQPDQTTCGSASLVLARMLNDPAYAMFIVTGYDPRTGVQQDPPGPVEGDTNPVAPDASSDARAMHDRFQHEAIAMHHQTSGLTDHDGDLNGWWPEAWGTSPGAAARQMGGGGGLSGVPGIQYDTSYVDPTDRASSYDDIVRAVDRGHVVPLFTYDIANAGGQSGAHVVLVTGTDADALRVYEPESGQTRLVPRAEFVGASLQDELGWDRPLVAVLPR